MLLMPATVEVGIQTEPPQAEATIQVPDCRDAAVQTTDCRESVRLVAVPEDSAGNNCMHCEQVDDLLCMVAELKEQSLRNR